MEAGQGVDAKVLRLTPYCPDFNSIEKNVIKN